jgi:drug/metabolite transporter (DMT)-like permease
MRWVLVVVVVVCNTLGDVLNTAGMKRHGEVDDLHPRHLLHLAVRVLRNPYVLAGLLTLAVSFIALLGLLSISNVSFAIPVTAIGYLLEVLLAKLVLKEQVHWRRWLGASLVACGVLLISL